MTIKHFFLDLWLTALHGKWVVVRERRYGHRYLGGIGWFWQYGAQCRRSDETRQCISKRVAEGVCASKNDMRGGPPQ